MTRRVSLLVALALAVCLAAPGQAAASRTQESIFQDDEGLVYGSDAQVEDTLSVLRSLGVDRIRVTVLWKLLAPQAGGAARPSFDATDPAAYNPAAWNPYDRIVTQARRFGLAVLFTITGPGPLWASSNAALNQPMHDPNSNDFRGFVTAVGRRYSGGYADESVAPPSSGGGLPILPPPPPPPAPEDPVLPRVTFWSIWNEPNQPGWLRPQWIRKGGRTVPASPRIYRGLVDAGFAGLRASGHAGDTILIAETAPRGSQLKTAGKPMRPLIFIRDLYCVGRRLKPLRGGGAGLRSCPADASGSARFKSAHPGLFQAGGFAHHPYSVEQAPSLKDLNRDNVVLSGIPQLTKTLDRILRRYGRPRRLPIWLTEYGYQTDPPDPVIGHSWARQASWLNEAEYMAFRRGRVRSTAQFLLVDDGPNTTVPPSSFRYWGSTFQSGLITGDGTYKPSFLAYKHPLHASPRRVRRGRRVKLLGALRPAPNGVRLEARVELRRRGSQRWRLVRTATTRNRRNYLLVRVIAAASGNYRLNWRDPVTGARRYSREAGVKVVRKKAKKKRRARRRRR